MKRAKNKEGKNFIIALLEEAERQGMKSEIWPAYREYIETFVKLRNYLVHYGLEFSEGLRDKLRESIEAVVEIKGSSTKKKLATLGAGGILIRIPAEFVLALLDKIEQLATELLVPCGREAPDINSAIVNTMYGHKETV